MKPFIRHLFVLVIAAFFHASAQDTDAMSSALTTLYEQVAFVDAYKSYCDSAAPDSSTTNTEALTTWKTANNVAQIERVVTQFSALSPDIAQSYQDISTEFQAVFAKRFAGIETEACGDLPRLLEGEDSSLTALYPQEMQLLPSMAELLGQTSTGQTATGQTDTGQAPSGQTSLPEQTIGAEAAPEPGQYSCTRYTIDNYDNPGDILETSEGRPATLDLFANGQYSYYDGDTFPVEYGIGSLGILEWPDEIGFYSFHYNPDRYDPGYTSLDWLTGELRNDLYNETDISELSWEDSRDRPSSFYLGDNGHTEIFLAQEDAGFNLYRTVCSWAGPNGRKLPAEIMQATENPENYLQPANVTAPTPAAGAGGLSGLYLSAEGDSLYFLANGYFYERVYRWGFDTLDCGRVWTQEEYNEPVCQTYLIQGSGLQLGERIPESQQECETVTKQSLGADGNLYYDYSQDCSPIEGYDPTTDGFLPFSQNSDGSLTIEDVQYIPVAPEQNLMLAGSYEYSWSSVNASAAAGGTDRITFTPDGQFVYGEDSYAGMFSTTYTPGDTATTSISEGQNPNAGSYSINGYTITFSFDTGLTLNYSFFRTGADSFKLHNSDFIRAEEAEE